MLARRLVLALMAAGATAGPLAAAPRQEPAAAAAPVPLPVQSVPQPSGGSVALSLRRSAGSVEVVIEGTGASPVLQQGRSGATWVGQLRTAAPSGLRMGPQQFTLPEAGLQSIRLQGSGSDYQLQVVPMPGAPLGRPVVSADGRNLILSFPTAPQAMPQSARLDLRTPGTVPQPSYAPPLQPRAVAPPLGDMAVGSMVLRNRSFLSVNGPSVSMTMRNAPARDVLMALAQMGGYGFVYVDDDAPVTAGSGGAAATATTSVNPAQGRPVSISFRGESYARAINSVLLAAGLQGKLEGNMILAGPSVLGKTFGAQLSKVYRLNQASAASAADYLASLGAKITKVTLITNTVSQGQTQANQVAGAPDTQQTQIQRLTTTETYGASTGPLKGLTGTTDSRLQTVTLVGDPQVVAVAENYLKQIDLRQRQVALSVRILDVSLENDSELANSFAFRSGNMFLVSNNGQLLANFGSYKPPGSVEGGLPGQYNGADGTTPISGTGSLPAAGGFIDQPSAPYPLPGSGTTIGGPYRPGFGTFANPLQPGVTEIDKDGKITYKSPDRFQYPQNRLFDFFQAKITSSSTKVLASPTLILQENAERSEGSDASRISEDGKIGREKTNEALVQVGTQYVTSYEVKQDVNGNNFCQPVFSNAGLTFGARVDKIDDNGFVTFSLSPEISAAVSEQRVGNCGSISVINARSLDTGRIRVRDGQTLILTGVISDQDRQAVQKWPLLGDLPWIGQFFRASSGSRAKNELVILVTPRIVDDAEGGSFGYGYRPATPDSRSFMSGSAAGFSSAF